MKVYKGQVKVNRNQDIQRNTREENNNEIHVNMEEIKSTERRVDEEGRIWCEGRAENNLIKIALLNCEKYVTLYEIERSVLILPLFNNNQANIFSMVSQYVIYVVYNKNK